MMENKYSERKFIVLDEKDNVAVALADLPSGTVLEIGRTKLYLKEEIPFRLKFSIRPIKKGDPVIKDGLPIGYATEDIDAGQVVHVHNVVSTRSREWKQ